MISKTQIKSRVVRKSNPEVKDLIILANANKSASWKKIAAIASGPARRFVAINLDDLEEKTSAGDTVIIVGKLLSRGSLTKKLRICGLSISAQAKDKLKESKSEFVSILDEFKKNPKGEGLKIIQ